MTDTQSKSIPTGMGRFGALEHVLFVSAAIGSLVQIHLQEFL